MHAWPGLPVTIKDKYIKMPTRIVRRVDELIVKRFSWQTGHQDSARSGGKCARASSAFSLGDELASTF
jgi:hypothetical protein